MDLDTSKIITPSNRAEWRAWLEGHYRAEKEVWLAYYRKGAGPQRIPYEDTVKEALCFGWIDSTVKKLDEARLAQRFTPRDPRSAYSQANKERLRLLIDQELIADDVLAGLGDVDPEGYIFPEDILDALKTNPEAWSNYQGYPAPYQRIRVAFIDGARDRPEEFVKRLNHFVKMTAEGRQFGYGIEEFYR